MRFKTNHVSSSPQDAKKEHTCIINTSKICIKHETNNLQSIIFATNHLNQMTATHLHNMNPFDKIVNHSLWIPIIAQSFFQFGQFYQASVKLHHRVDTLFWTNNSRTFNHRTSIWWFAGQALFFLGVQQYGTAWRSRSETRTNIYFFKS